MTPLLTRCPGDNLSLCEAVGEGKKITYAGRLFTSSTCSHLFRHYSPLSIYSVTNLPKCSCTHCTGGKTGAVKN